MDEALREIASTIFYSLIRDEDEAHQAAAVLREAVSRKFVRTPLAREVLLEIAEHTVPAAPPPRKRYRVEGNLVRLEFPRP
jgi:hypothetical protein